MGDSPDGLKPESEDHDTASTSELRLRELKKSAAALSIGNLELLGYRDSGMKGWPQNDDPTSFWQTPLDQAVERVAELMERYRPEVVVTYDASGLYGHPDHIQAHRATVGAAERTGIPKKIYEIAFPQSLLDAWTEMQRAQGGETPPAGEDDVPLGTPDELITTTVDISSAWDPKWASISAHESQMANFDFLKLEPDLLKVALGKEYFVRRFDRTGAPVPETDLFAGIA
jgi:LmbE family N-acetylglucosaminyl deacetylase